MTGKFVPITGPLPVATEQGGFFAIPLAIHASAFRRQYA